MNFFIFIFFGEKKNRGLKKILCLFLSFFLKEHENLLAFQEPTCPSIHGVWAGGVLMMIGLFIFLHKIWFTNLLGDRGINPFILSSLTQRQLLRVEPYIHLLKRDFFPNMHNM
jgi:hypothetical protein